jgi:DNA-binding transcriptional LysR family regulator
MDMDELRAFVAVVETGSLVAAARSLRFARATLRRRIDELEVRAGVPLLTRSEQGVTPTAAGTVLAAKARIILQDVSALLGAVREVGAEATEPSGHLTIVVPVGMPPQALAMSLALLHERFPKLTCHLLPAAEPLTQLEGADLVIYFGPKDPTGAWRSVELSRARIQLLASNGYLAEHGTPTTLAQLEEHALAVWEEPGGDRNAIPLLAGGTAPVTPFFSSTDPHLLHHLGEQGAGLVLVPYTPDVDALQGASPLVPVLTDLVGQHLSLRLAVPASLAELPRTRAVFEAVLEFLDAARIASAGGERAAG